MRRIVLSVTLLLSLLFGLAAFGVFADSRRENGQNLLGGMGNVRTAPRTRSIIQPSFYDDKNVYVEEYVGRNNELFAMDLQTGQKTPVCSRPLCDHSSADCPLARLYKTQFLDYFVLEDKLYYYTKDDEDLTLYEWDVMSGKDIKLCTFPEHETATDEQGTVIKIDVEIDCIERINADTLFIASGNSAYILDNSFSLKSRFRYARGTEFAMTEDDIYFMQNTDFFRYSISENKLYDKILEAEGVTLLPHPSYFYCYNNKLYFFSGEHICTYSPNSTDNKIEEVAEAFPMPGFAMFGERLYYADGDMNIYLLNLDSGETQKLEGLSAIPLTEIDGRLLIHNGESSELWDGE